MLTYCIGDIHGRADLLDRLLAAIEADRAGRPRHLVFLGDYIDRGPESARVIATLRALEAREPGAVVCLAGNHEDILVRALTDPADEADWMTNGGAGPTLASYGVDRVAALPRDVLDWLRDLRTLHADSRRYYVHAGLRPGRPAEADDRQARLWIRDAFLEGDHDFGLHVVHGHTPRLDGRPDVLAHRTNLDTAVSYGGRLTAGIFSETRDTAVGYLQVTLDGELVSLSETRDR